MRSCSDGDKCFKNGTERAGDGEEREGQSNGVREEEKDMQTEEDWEKEDCREFWSVYPSTQQRHGNSGLNSDMASQVLACSLCTFSHIMVKLHQHIRIRHGGEDRKRLCSKESGTESTFPQAAQNSPSVSALGTKGRTGSISTLKNLGMIIPVPHAAQNYFISSTD